MKITAQLKDAEAVSAADRRKPLTKLCTCVLYRSSAFPERSKASPPSALGLAEIASAAVQDTPVAMFNLCVAAMPATVETQIKTAGFTHHMLKACRLYYSN